MNANSTHISATNKHEDWHVIFTIVFCKKCDNCIICVSVLKRLTSLYMLGEGVVLMVSECKTKITSSQQIGMWINRDIARIKLSTRLWNI